MQYGMRVGWNSRGGTDADHLRIERQAAKARMDAALRPVLEALGEGAYLAWVEDTLTDTDGINEIVAKAGQELARLEQEAACTCTPLTTTACPACLRATANNEIPF